MAHAKQEHLKDLHILISEVRKISVLKEKSFGCFYFKGKGVLHFHIKAGRRYAHVFEGEKWAEVDLVVSMLEKAQNKFLRKSSNFYPSLCEQQNLISIQDLFKNAQ